MLLGAAQPALGRREEHPADPGVALVFAIGRGAQAAGRQVLEGRVPGQPHQLEIPPDAEGFAGRGHGPLQEQGRDVVDQRCALLRSLFGHADQIQIGAASAVQPVGV